MKKPKIFICHSSVDKPFARWLVARLKQDAVEAWLDEVEVRIGESIHQKVNEGLAQSDFFAIVLSKASVNSKWVQEELSSASSMEKYTKKGIFVLPLLLEECEVPLLLLDRRYANFSQDKESAYSELLDAIYHHFKIKHPDADVAHLMTHKIDDHFIDTLVKNPEFITKLSPRQFEEVVASMFRDFGFDVMMTPVTKDGGYDIIMQRQIVEGLAPQRIIVECKRYASDRPISVEIVARLYGCLTQSTADRAVIVTTSRFTKAATEAARRWRIDIVDYDGLRKWLASLYRNR